MLVILNSLIKNLIQHHFHLSFHGVDLFLDLLFCVFAIFTFADIFILCSIPVKKKQVIKYIHVVVIFLK